MHLLLIHQAFASRGEAGSTRHVELARHLVRRGHRVTVIASRVSYLTGQPLKVDAEDEVPGLRVIRVPVYGGHHRSFTTRVVSFVTFMGSAFVTALRIGDADVVWGTMPPIFQVVTAAAVARLRRVPLLVEVRDLWPDFAIQTGVLQHPVLIALSRWLERWLYRRADRVVVNSPGFVPHIVSNGVPSGRIDVVANGVEVADYHPEDRGEAVRREFGVTDKCVILYAGAHGLANDLGTLLLAAKRLNDEPGLAIVLVGDGKERPALMRQAAAWGLANVTFVPAQPKRRMPEFIAASDVCVAILKPIPMFATTYPNKVFDYMAAGRPTVLAIDGVIRKVIEEAEGGTYVPPGDPEALAGALRAYARDPALRRTHGAYARRYVAAHFDRRKQVEKLEQVLSTLMTRRRSRALAAAAKRAMDIVVSAAALIAASPVVLAIALAIKLDDGGPVFFVDRRSGRNARPFPLYKFRTMVVDAEHRGLGRAVAKGDPRITQVGRLLREFTLDELPQFFNVLLGHMSLVGPRPGTLDQARVYEDFERRRLEVRPGMTGWAWIRGRNDLPWEERIKLDVWYIDHWSLWLDLRILFKTPLKILRREGLYGKEGVTPDFKGY